MAEFEKRLACVIAADGKIARGYMIDKCEFNGVNEYIVTWKVPLQGAAKTNFAGTIGVFIIPRRIEFATGRIAGMTRGELNNRGLGRRVGDVGKRARSPVE